MSSTYPLTSPLPLSGVLGPPPSWSGWILRRDQVLIGMVRRRWGGTWEGFDSHDRRLICRAVTRQEAVHALLDHAGHDR